ncbi:Membrane transporter [Schizosaccharomyces pombe]|uniref:Uncharacterized MFS-type transporter C330.07c n=1 Tax=Schizosaccharomyces pombe (strain 972 / ATCC 24843) TaxID=284812 RepID=YJ87_SCHPO|nr:putative transporter [Schizosaccharomyces pombe]Q12519.1 RecName: Full=Uncharacterized MFS-type transporter C330.07c [Schizosaccharomyces pombe 972h-]AAC37421.1 unknown [Schizosaccharomyces pombe]CAA20912.1 membrane transporter (predicted) [Schizosaccharomyces pombe]CAA81750.1 hypothetical protein [Schizosaccharomyces pombe]|eukprot:NP_587707.1 putative transporter [Schizosaccharomyces pombe]
MEPSQRSGSFSSISRRRSRVDSRPTYFKVTSKDLGFVDQVSEEYEFYTYPKKASEVESVTETFQSNRSSLVPTYPVDENANKLPPKVSIAFILINSLMSDMSLAVALPTSASYTQSLGGTNAFSGLVIGIPTLISLIFLYPMLCFANPKSANGYTLYFRPMVVSSFAHIFGHLLYCMAYRANWIYLILIGRMLNGIGFTTFLYHKKYTTDKLLVGQNRRTFLATMNILAQTLGFMAGPFLGGILAKATIHSKNAVWNQYTVASWVMLFMWFFYMLTIIFFFKEVTADKSEKVSQQKENDDEDRPKLSWKHKFLLFFLAEVAFIAYFTVNGYQASISIYTGKLYNYDAFQSGNFIALSALIVAPFILASSFLSRWLEDRHIMLGGLFLGILAVAIHLVLDAVHKLPMQVYFFLYSLMIYGYSIGSAPLISLSSKQLHPRHHNTASIVVQVGVSLSNTFGSICGGAIYNITTVGFISLCLGLAAVVYMQLIFMWGSLKCKTH